MYDKTYGSHCALPDCKQLDFLPFVCEFCKKTYCKVHRTHGCKQESEAENKAIVCPVCQKTVKYVSTHTPDETFDIHYATECIQQMPDVQQK